jgi:hypothetical protein
MGLLGQPAVQPYLGRAGLVVTRRVPGSARALFCEGAPPSFPYTSLPTSASQLGRSRRLWVV